MRQEVKHLVWLNGTDVELAEMKKRGNDQIERDKDVGLQNSNAFEDLLGKMALPDLWDPLE